MLPAGWAGTGEKMGSVAGFNEGEAGIVYAGVSEMSLS